MSNTTETRVRPASGAPNTVSNSVTQIRPNRSGYGPAAGSTGGAPRSGAPRSSASWLQENLIRVIAGLATLALFAGILVVALGSRTGSRLETDSRPIAVPTAEVGVIDPIVGLPIDANGAFVPGYAAPVVVDLFSDFSCPFCRQFAENHGDTLIALASDPNISVRYHPVSFLDRSGDRSGWSTLAASVFLETAATHPQSTWAVSKALLAHQGDGLIGDAVVEMINAETGTNLPPMAQILANQSANLDAFMSNAQTLMVSHVPMVLINGVEWDSQADPDLAAAVRRSLP
ncbi:MAG: DsbA family protein [Cellulomonadaceae bacterium]|nr:DsbA family protein [Cellulomonadaceae bacterium]